MDKTKICRKCGNLCHGKLCRECYIKKGTSLATRRIVNRYIKRKLGVKE